MTADGRDVKRCIRSLLHAEGRIDRNIPRDATFLNADLFEPEGVVVMPGENPSLENVGA